jgi:SlyX protein
MTNDTATEERLIDIEIKLSRQEDLVDTLNQMVYQQQKQIDRLDALCSAMTRHINAMADSAGPSAGTVYEKPPHY